MEMRPEQWRSSNDGGDATVQVVQHWKSSKEEELQHGNSSNTGGPETVEMRLPWWKSSANGGSATVDVLHSWQS